MSKIIIKNSLSSTFLYVVNIIIAFVMSPVLIRALGNRDYGLWELVMSVIGYMGLLDLGIGPALVRFVSVAEGRNDREDLQETISTSFVFFVIIGIVAMFTLWGLGLKPTLVGGVEINEVSKLSTVFMLLGINAGLLFPLDVFIATLMGVQRHYFINNVRIVVAGLQAVLLYFLLHRFEGDGLIVLALLTPVFTIIQFIFFTVAVVSAKNIPSIRWSAVKLSKARELVTFAAKSASMMIASRLQNQSVPLIIGHVVGLSYIVYFVIPNRLISYAKGLSLAIGFPLTPFFGSTFGKGDKGKLIKSWINASFALQIITLAMPIVIYYVAVPFIALWLGEEYSANGRLVIYILLPGLVADGLATNAFRMLTAQGKHGQCALMWLFISALSIPLGIWGANRWGIEGAAMGVTMVTVVANLITLSMACSVMSISLSQYFAATIKKLLLPLSVLAGTLGGLCFFCPVKDYYILLMNLFISGVIYVMVVWRFTLNQEIRNRIFEKLKSCFQ